MVERTRLGARRESRAGSLRSGLTSLPLPLSFFLSDTQQVLSRPNFFFLSLLLFFFRIILPSFAPSLLPPWTRCIQGKGRRDTNLSSQRVLPSLWFTFSWDGKREVEKEEREEEKAEKKSEEERDRGRER